MKMLGHGEAWREWRAAIAGDKMHHGWILAGRRGIGKASFAARAAAETVGAGASEPNSHPDILFLGPQPENEDEERKRAEGKPYKVKRSIAVDQVRALQRRLVTRPTLGDRRVIIVDAADDLERNAFNALLKSLEEPPQGTIFLLVAHRLGRIPATIRSRCRTLRFTELADAEVNTILQQQLPSLSADERRAAVDTAGGSPGAALDFAQRGLHRAQHLMQRITEDGDRDFSLRGAMLGELGSRPDRDQIIAAIEAARMVLVRALPDADRTRGTAIVEAHGQLVRLLVQAPTANFDPTTLLLDIGGLLASAATDREAA